ncbi:PLP-dependent aminotransferase family protein [Candidatus Bathyarchaeota archaeon]|nr:MAG: PLP-dependent aminotransferase family protein [Candidatus Bathyarchaeota archaeon]
MFDAEKFYSELGKSYQPGIITQVVLASFELRKQGKKLISLTGGLYDPDSVPYEPVKEILAEASVEDWQEILQYGNTYGSMELRQELSKFMAGHGIEADPKEIMVTCGSQQALDVISRVFIDTGDVVIVGSPTYLQALSAFRQFHPEIRTAAIDADGMDPDALEAELRKLASEGKAAKILYMVPSFQNPTSTMLTVERRKRVLELAEEHDFLVVEDNPYGYISFDQPMPTPIAGMDESGRVMYTSTFSKIVSPGLRIGWLKAREEFIIKMGEAKSNVSICNDGLSTHVATGLFKRGAVEAQIPRITEVYRRKRDLMLETMDISFPEEAEWNDPKGGLFLWVKMPGHVNTTEMLMEAVNNGVAYIPGSNFFAKPVHNYIRLNYSFPSDADIVEGIQILGGMLKEKL